MYDTLFKEGIKLRDTRQVAENFAKQARSCFGIANPRRRPGEENHLTRANHNYTVASTIEIEFLTQAHQILRSYVNSGLMSEQKFTVFRN